jgi:hypothetical protein
MLISLGIDRTGHFASPDADQRLGRQFSRTPAAIAGSIESGRSDVQLVRAGHLAARRHTAAWCQSGSWSGKDNAFAREAKFIRSLKYGLSVLRHNWKKSTASKHQFHGR